MCPMSSRSVCTVFLARLLIYVARLKNKLDVIIYPPLKPSIDLLLEVQKFLVAPLKPPVGLETRELRSLIKQLI